MTIKFLINIFISLINVFILARYIYLLRSQRISPSLAMWTFFSLATGISLFTYFAEGDYNISDNILNLTDLILVVSVFAAIFVLGDRSTRFNRFDLFCLIIVGIIILFWAFSNNHILTNFAVQGILVISYFPVVSRMIHQKKNTEDFFIWIALFTAPLISLLANEGLLASVYAIRAIFCTALLLGLMLRIEFQKNKDS